MFKWAHNLSLICLWMGLLHEQFPFLPVIRFIASVGPFHYWISFIWCNERQQKLQTKLTHKNISVYPHVIVTSTVSASLDNDTHHQSCSCHSACGVSMWIWKLSQRSESLNEAHLTLCRKVWIIKISIANRAFAFFALVPKWEVFHSHEARE